MTNAEVEEMAGGTPLTDAELTAIEDAKAEQELEACHLDPWSAARELCGCW